MHEFKQDSVSLDSAVKEAAAFIAFDTRPRNTELAQLSS